MTIIRNYFSSKERHIATVSDRIRYGKDMQADDKYIVLEPKHWSEYDPFLLMAEDWFSTNGFDWHPHRGIETITAVLEGELEHHDSHGGCCCANAVIDKFRPIPFIETIVPTTRENVIAIGG